MISSTAPPVPFEPGGPELLLGVGTVQQRGEEFVGSMRTGAWTTAPDGSGCAGALGVLVDDVLGSSVLMTRPPNWWSVSTEISIEVVADVPTDGSVLTCSGRVVQRHGRGGLARGEVLDDEGRCVAVATQRQRFVPGDPTAAPTTSSPPPQPGAPRAGALATIGGTLRRHGEGTELVLAGSTDLANPAGNVHGGISLLAADLVAGAVLDGPSLVTASVHIVYVRPLPFATETICTAEVVHSGRTLGVARVTGRSAAGKACMVATVTRHAREG